MVNLACILSSPLRDVGDGSSLSSSTTSSDRPSRRPPVVSLPALIHTCGASCPDTLDVKALYWPPSVARLSPDMLTVCCHVTKCVALTGQPFRS